MVLLARPWAPYPKWFGGVFADLPVGAAVGKFLDAALDASGWQVEQWVDDVIVLTRPAVRLAVCTAAATDRLG